MRNLRVQLAYDGSRFFGWQRQDGFPSVQEELERAIQALLGQTVTVHGAGRTDTGVHALRQVASFRAATRLDDERLFHALNAHLGEGVAVRALETCRDGFHAQHDARGKRYLYLVRTTRFRPAFGKAHSHWVPDPLDAEAIRCAAGHFQGRHDFTSFANTGSPRHSNVRTVTAVRVVARREAFALVVQGEGFLYNMVRTIAGTLLDVGRGRTSPERIPAILEARDRTLAGPTAPASGLYLLNVLYREPCFARTAGGRRPAGLFA